MKRFKATSLLGICLLIGASSFLKAQKPSLQTVQNSTIKKYALNYLQKEGTVGISVGIIHDGKNDEYHFGQIEKGSRSAPTSTTLYSIGSIANFCGYLNRPGGAGGKM
ncbi:hypothetical protein GCM10027347_38340 [Larkinella harenae]